MKSQLTFTVADITDLSFLGDARFDLVLDWAALHCIPKEMWKEYAAHIAAHTHKDSLYLLRAFAKEPAETHEFIIDHATHTTTKVYLFDDAIIDELFGDAFRVIRTHHSKPRTKAHRSFNEYLMVRM